MTVEQAIFYKYILISGYPEELNTYVDKSLYNEQPVSEIILDLSACGTNRKRALQVLNEFIAQFDSEQIDDNEVFNLTRQFLKHKYLNEKMPIDKVADTMHRIASLTDKCDNPWETMSILGELYEDAKSGHIFMESYMDAFNKFINDGILMEFTAIDDISSKPSFFKRILSKLRMIKPRNK